MRPPCAALPPKTNMLHHHRVPNLIINPSAPATLKKPQMKASPSLKNQIVKLKLAGVCSVEIFERTGATDSIVQKAWREYRDAHPEAAHVPNGNRRKTLTKSIMADIVDQAALA